MLSHLPCIAHPASCPAGSPPAGFRKVTSCRELPASPARSRASECRDKLDELRREKARTGTVAPRNITVEQCVRAFLASSPPEWRTPITIQVNTAHAERIIKAIGSVRLVSLTPGQVRSVLDQMVRDGYATATISATKGILA